MNRRSIDIPAVISYLSWAGWFIALFVRDPSDRFASHHLNQALVINIIISVAGFLRIVPLLGAIAYSIVSIAGFVLWVMGIYRAIVWRDDPLPFIGQIHIIG